MKTSTDRILTTHTGSLPRPKPLIDLILGREKRRRHRRRQRSRPRPPRRWTTIVAQQVAAGIDVVSDGEMSKPSYTTYIRHRVTGIEPDPRAAEKGRDIMIGRDLLAHPDFGASRQQFQQPRRFPAASARCATRTAARSTATSPISRRRRRKSKPTDVFMTAPSPGILTRFIINLHYPTEDAYVDGARRDDEDRVPRDRRGRLRAADRRARPRLRRATTSTAT